MNEQVTRQILWNIPAPFIVLMYGLLSLLMAAFVYAGVRWYRLVTLGVSEDRLDRPVERLLLSLRASFGQGNVIREPGAGCISPSSSRSSDCSSARRSF